MLGGVLDLGELQVADVMVHRTKMETFDVEDSPQRIVDEIHALAVFQSANLEG